MVVVRGSSLSLCLSLTPKTTYNNNWLSLYLLSLSLFFDGVGAQKRISECRYGGGKSSVTNSIRRWRGGRRRRRRREGKGRSDSRDLYHYRPQGTSDQDLALRCGLWLLLLLLYTRRTATHRWELADGKNHHHSAAQTYIRNIESRRLYIYLPSSHVASSAAAVRVSSFFFAFSCNPSGGGGGSGRWMQLRTKTNRQSHDDATHIARCSSSSSRLFYILCI